MAEKKKTTRTRQTNKKPRYRDISEVERHKSFAFYGRAGSGKTTLAGTFPKALLLDIRDEGTDSVRDVKGLKVWDIEDLDDLEDAYWFLHKEPHDFETVILDTVTMLQNLKIEDLVGAKLRKLGKQAGDWGTMTKQDWGAVSAYMKDQITNFRDLPINTVFLAQERVFNIDDENDEMGVLDPEIGPSLSPSVKSHLNAAVNVIGNTFIRSRTINTKDEKGRKKSREKIEYCLRVGPNSVYTTKIRKPKSIDLPDVIVNPTFDDIMDAIEGE